MPTSFNPSAFLDQVRQANTPKLSEAQKSFESGIKASLPNLLTQTLSKEGIQLNAIAYSGSYVKGTDINTGRDIDYILPVRAGKFKSPQEMYEALHKILSKMHTDKLLPNLRLQTVSFGVTYQHTDNSELRVDLVPGLEDKEGQYLAMGNLWLWDRLAKNKILTNIEKQKEELKKCPDVTRNLIRLLKVWKTSGNGPKHIRSIMIELLAIEATKAKKISAGMGLWEGFKAFIGYIGERGSAKLTDPGNQDNDLMKLLSPAQWGEFANQCARIRKRLDADAEGELKKMFGK